MNCEHRFLGTDWCDTNNARTTNATSAAATDASLYIFIFHFFHLLKLAPSPGNVRHSCVAVFSVISQSIIFRMTNRTFQHLLTTPCARNVSSMMRQSFRKIRRTSDGEFRMYSSDSRNHHSITIISRKIEFSLVVDTGRRHSTVKRTDKHVDKWDDFFVCPSREAPEATFVLPYLIT